MCPHRLGDGKYVPIPISPDDETRLTPQEEADAPAARAPRGSCPQSTPCPSIPPPLAPPAPAPVKETLHVTFDHTNERTVVEAAKAPVTRSDTHPLRPPAYPSGVVHPIPTTQAKTVTTLSPPPAVDLSLGSDTRPLAPVSGPADTTVTPLPGTPPLATPTVAPSNADVPTSRPDQAVPVSHPGPVSTVPSQAVDAPVPPQPSGKARAAPPVARADPYRLTYVTESDQAPSVPGSVPNLGRPQGEIPFGYQILEMTCQVCQTMGAHAPDCLVLMSMPLR